jgi:hypothetical protein
MIALAIMLEFDEIHIYGVDMATDVEYHQQRPSVEYFCGVAFGIWKVTGKCRIYVPPQCDLLKTIYQYGYDGDREIGFRKKINARKNELQGRINQFVDQARQARDNEMIMRGAWDNMTYIERCLVGGNDVCEET